MKKIIYILATLFYLIAFTDTILSQKVQEEPDNKDQIEHQDVVYLKDGSILRGKITEWSFGEKLSIIILGGIKMEILDSDIEKVRQELMGDNRFRRARRDFKFKETGLYNTFGVNFALGSELGVGVTYSIGHRFNRWLSIGGGFGYQDFEIDWGAQIIPIFAEGRGYLSEKKISPYYSLRTGLGFPIVNANYNVVSTKPGILLNPEIGYRFGGHDVQFYLGVGYHLQKAEYTIEPSWWESRVDIDKLTYKRLDLKFGLEF